VHKIVNTFVNTALKELTAGALHIRYTTIRWRIFTCAQKLANSQLNLPHGTKQKRLMKKLKIKADMLRRNGPVVKSVESVLRPEGSLWWERFVKKR